jgi:drug/metabolite transporter (DMT)-like permease
LPYFVLAGGLGTIFLWLLVLQRRVEVSHVRQHADWHLVRLLALRSLSAWGYLLGLRYVSVAVANYVSGMSVVFIVVFGIYYLKERDHMREKFMALAFAFVGLTLILIGRL